MWSTDPVPVFGSCPHLVGLFGILRGADVQLDRETTLVTCKRCNVWTVIAYPPPHDALYIPSEIDAELGSARGPEPRSRPHSDWGLPPRIAAAVRDIFREVAREGKRRKQQERLQ